MSLSKSVKGKAYQNENPTSKSLMILTKSATSISEQISNKEEANSIDGSVKDKFVKIMDDFKLITRDFHINESFEDEGDRFPQFKDISRSNDIIGGL